jgi:ADP-heptose:LPS heptosyltransferase
MPTNERRILIINFGGIGNGIMILPILKKLEEAAPNHLYFHTHNPVFDLPNLIDWLGLKNFLGTVPSVWRRFQPARWATIKNFLSANRIDAIVNLRNEGPRRDLGYFSFKQEMAHSGIEFWELDQSQIEHRADHCHLVEDQANLFQSHGIEMRLFNRLWLRDYVLATGRKRAARKEIGFFTGASQEVKTWPAVEWAKLGRKILARTDFNIVVYAGEVEREKVLAQEVAEQLQNSFSRERCTLVANQTLESLYAHMSGLELLISNDTSSVHIAAALDVPTIGLYFSTDSMIWGGLNEKFTAVQSGFGLACPSFKRDAGNCDYYYGGCPGPCKAEVTPQRVYQALGKYISSDLYEPVESLAGAALNQNFPGCLETETS